MQIHVESVLGDKPLQQLRPADIDKLDAGLEGKISDRTACHVHRVLNACLSAAVRTKVLGATPIDRAEKVPSAGEGDHGVALDDEQLKTLVIGLRKSTLFPLVYVLAFTGCRRNEALALRWSDLDTEKKTLRIERAWEETAAYGMRLKPPRREAHKRTITIDDDMITVLVAERETHQRLIAGIGDRAGAGVDLALVKLPDDALMFPTPPAKGAYSLSTPRNPRATTKGSSARPRSSASGCTTCGGRTKPACSMPAWACMWWRVGAGMTRRCCCGSTPSGRRRRTPQPRPRSPRCPRAFSNPAQLLSKRAAAC
jgi:integrase